MTLQDRIEDFLITFGAAGMTREKAEEQVTVWRDRAQEKVGDEKVEAAAGFQRHYTKFGTGLPPNFLLALTPDWVHAFKFDPRRAGLDVTSRQIKKQVGRWERSGVRVSGVAVGNLTTNLTLTVPQDGEAQDIACRTPRIEINPQAAVVIGELGGEIR